MFEKPIRGTWGTLGTLQKRWKENLEPRLRSVSRPIGRARASGAVPDKSPPSPQSPRMHDSYLSVRHCCILYGRTYLELSSEDACNLEHRLGDRKSTRLNSSHR